MGQQGDRTDRALLRLLKYRAKRKMFYPGRPRQIDPYETRHYAREISRALRKAGLKLLEQLTKSSTVEMVAETLQSIPPTVKIPLYASAVRPKGWTDPVREVLLGGWKWRGKTMTVFVPPQNGNPPKTVERPVTARTLPELMLFKTAGDPQTQAP